jgi:hypothetical protein
MTYSDFVSDWAGKRMTLADFLDTHGTWARDNIGFTPDPDPTDTYPVLESIDGCVALCHSEGMLYCAGGCAGPSVQDIWSDDDETIANWLAEFGVDLKDHPQHHAITVNGAWYIDYMPDDVVIELDDGSLMTFKIVPFREIALEDLRPYDKGRQHPRKISGNPVPVYLYRFYGLTKNAESATEVIHVRVTPTEKAAIERYAANLEPRKSTSEVLRDYIRSLG